MTDEVGAAERERTVTAVVVVVDAAAFFWMKRRRVVDADDRRAKADIMIYILLIANIIIQDRQRAIDDMGL